jgi:hypothetical protein
MRSNGLIATGQPIVDPQTRSQSQRTHAAVAINGNQKAEGLDSMGAESHETSPLIQRAPDHPKVELLEIAEPAVDKL